MMNCTRCVVPVTNDTLCGTKDKPYCAECWMIVFYGFPEDELEKIMTELDQHRARGIDEATLKMLFMSALRKHANKTVTEKLSGFAPVLDRILMQRGRE